MKKNRIKAIGLNLIAPGIGQFLIKRHLRASLFLGSALVSLGWACWLVVKPTYHNIMAFINNSPDETGTFNFLALGSSVLLFCVVWGWSVADVACFPPKEAVDDQNC